MAFIISADLARGRVRAQMSGFLDLDEVARFSREEQDAARAVTRQCGSFDLLIEAPDGKAQAQDVMGAFQHLVAHSQLKARHIAIVAASPLLRMQIRRVLTTDHIRVFEMTADADAWMDDLAAASS